MIERKWPDTCIDMLLERGVEVMQASTWVRSKAKHVLVFDIPRLWILSSANRKLV
jgi:hypothetical protein